MPLNEYRKWHSQWTQKVAIFSTALIEFMHNSVRIQWNCTLNVYNIECVLLIVLCDTRIRYIHEFMRHNETALLATLPTRKDVSFCTKDKKNNKAHVEKKQPHEMKITVNVCVFQHFKRCWTLKIMPVAVLGTM